MKPISSKFFLISLLSIVVALAIAACAVSDAPSDDASAPVVEEEQTTVEPTDAPVEEAAEIESEPEAESEADTASESDAASEPDTASASSGALVFTIVPEQSEARFYIDEELRGNPVTVIGVSSSLNGQLAIDPADPTLTQIEPITIDAASFVTDSDRRNGAIRQFVLSSDSYPTITFTPSTIESLPESVAVGDTFEFQVTGDLTLKDETRSETFDVSVTVDSENQLTGLATATIIYADYGIFIPDVPFVANVGDELKLEFDFVAAQ